MVFILGVAGLVISAVLITPLREANEEVLDRRSGSSACRLSEFVAIMKDSMDSDFSGPLARVLEAANDWYRFECMEGHDSLDYNEAGCPCREALLEPLDLAIYELEHPQ